MKTHSLLQVAAFCLSVVLVNGFRKRAIIAERLPRWGVLRASLKCNDMPLSLAEQGRLSISRVAPIVNAIVAIFLASKANAAGPAYLVEPTAEFLEEEQRVSAFNAAQGKIRKDWDEIVAKLQGSDDPKVTAQLLRDLKAFLVKLQDLPVGVKKRELVKLCRAKKFNGRKIKANWTTEVEIEYESLIQEINRRLAPVNADTKL